MAKANRRQQRINQLIRDEIDRLLRHETDDPLLSTMISVTEVETTQDLQKSKIYVSFLDDEHEAEIMARLRKAARFFRREVAEALNLRHTPEFEFVYDPSIARGARVLQLLREHAPPPETPAGTDVAAAADAPEGGADTATSATVAPRPAD
jgi:ribosome-binding factor A